MATIPKIHKEQLGLLLAKGHRQFGLVAARRPYRDDDDEGGEGGSELLFESHPLLAEQPEGAASDLAMIVQDNEYSVEEAEDRASEASNELRKQPALQQALAKQQGFVPPAPGPAR